MRFSPYFLLWSNMLVYTLKKHSMLGGKVKIVRGIYGFFACSKPDVAVDFYSTHRPEKLRTLSCADK